MITGNTMKKITNLIMVMLLLSISVTAQETKEFKFYNGLSVEVKNTADVERVDELVAVDLNDLNKSGKFNEHAFIVYDNDEEIASQVYTDGENSYVLFVTDLAPEESKTFKVLYHESGVLRKDYPSRTYAELAMKFDAVYKDKKFTSDHFENFTKVVVPQIHTDHDALFKYEGPGWESEKVGYRFYLDWRNATDIFGKKEYKLVLHDVGTNDVIAKDDSYHEMLDWGMDVFKVGNTLGIGSIAMKYGDTIERVAKTDTVISEIKDNGPLLSEVVTTYKGWEIDGKKYDLRSEISIGAGSRLSNNKLTVNNNAENITTGIAKHEDTEFVKSDVEGDWQYIALFGKQSLAGDNLGVVVFYKKSALTEQGDDDLNYYVVLKPENGVVEYKFAGIWEQEPDGIKDMEAFKSYIDTELTKLNSPVSYTIAGE